MTRLNLSDNIMRFRHEKKLTQEELADFMGVTKASVSKWENAQSTPDILLLPQLAAFFGVTVDELIGYEPQLSGEQIRCYYAELSSDFARLDFGEAIEKTRSLAYHYYACYPFLLQLCILYCNHYMLAETEEMGKQILSEAVGWCDRIMDNCSDVGVCSDAFVMKAGLNLQLGRSADAIDALEPAANPARLTGQSGTILIQAYQMAGERDKAKSYAQVRQYLSLLELVGNAILLLSLYEDEPKRCDETIQRIRDVIDLYGLKNLHPNIVAQFHYQTAVVRAVNGDNVGTIDALRRFAECVEILLDGENPTLHGDKYFDRLDRWIDDLPLGNMPPRDKGFVRQNLMEALAHPCFNVIKEECEFKEIVGRMTGKVR